MQRSTSILAILALLLLPLVSAACDGSNPVASESASGNGPSAPAFGEDVSGTIASATLDGGATDPTIRLSNQIEIHLTASTVVDPTGDLTSLAAVRAALDAGVAVRAEARGTVQGGILVASLVRFETDTGSSGGTGSGNGSGADDGGSSGGFVDEIHATVQSVDLGGRLVTLEGGTRLRVATDALIEADGDFRTLAAVANAVASGVEVRVEADGGFAADGAFEATSAKFETDEGDGAADGGNTGGNPGGFVDEIHATVQSVDLGVRLVTLQGGTRLRVATDALIEADGDFRTLAAVANAVGSGVEVRVEADGGFGADGAFEASSAKFETDEGDGDDDDEVEGIVGSVDLAGRSVTTAGGRVIRIATDALIDDSGDVRTLADVEFLVSSGAEVEVEAKGVPTAEALVASEVRFEID